MVIVYKYRGLVTSFLPVPGELFFKRLREGDRGLGSETGEERAIARSPWRLRHENLGDGRVCRTGDFWSGAPRRAWAGWHNERQKRYLAYGLQSRERRFDSDPILHFYNKNKALNWVKDPVARASATSAEGFFDSRPRPNRPLRNGGCLSPSNSKNEYSFVDTCKTDSKRYRTNPLLTAPFSF